MAKQNGAAQRRGKVKRSAQQQRAAKAEYGIARRCNGRAERRSAYQGGAKVWYGAVKQSNGTATQGTAKEKPRKARRRLCSAWQSAAAEWLRCVLHGKGKAERRNVLNVAQRQGKEGDTMIVIQDFPNVTALQSWLHNKRHHCRDQTSFSKWLQGYLSNGRELTAQGRTYTYNDCIQLMAGN